MVFLGLFSTILLLLGFIIKLDIEERRIERAKLDHGKLIDRMIEWGYPANQKGICFGVACMGLQAILLNDIGTFNRRLENINKKDEKYNRLGNSVLWDIRAFYEGVFFFQYQQRETFFNLPRKDSCSSDFICEIASIVSPVEMDKMDGLSLHDRFFGLFEKKELIQLFLQLKKILIESNGPSIGILLTNRSHAVTVGFDSKKKKWVFVDANNFPAEWVTSEKRLQEKLQSSFFGLNLYEDLLYRKDLFLFSFSLYSTCLDKKCLELISKKWEEKTRFIRLQSLAENRWINHQSIASSLSRADDDLFFRGLENLWEHAFFDVNEEKEGLTLLGKFIKNNKIKRVEALLQNRRIDVNKKSDGFFTPLLCAISQIGTKRYTTEVLELLLAHENIDVNGETDIFGTALRYAVFMGNKNIVEALLSHPRIDPNMAGNQSYSCTPLEMAISKNNLEIVNLLLAHENIYVNGEVGALGSPLIYAVSMGNRNIVEALLSHPRIDPNVKIGCENSALQMAMSKNNLEIVKMLLLHKNINISTDLSMVHAANLAPLDLAIQQNNAEIIHSIDHYRKRKLIDNIETVGSQDCLSKNLRKRP